MKTRRFNCLSVIGILLALLMLVGTPLPMSAQSSYYLKNRLKNEATKIVRKEANKAINHARTHKPGTKRTVKVETMPASIEEFEELRMEIGTQPEGAVALTIIALAMYSELGQEVGEACLDLCNDELGFTSFFRRRLQEWYVQGVNQPRPYQAAAYMKGASPSNGYNPTQPYTMEMYIDNSTYTESGELTMLRVAYSGSQSVKEIKVTVIDSEDGFYYVHANPSMYSKVQIPAKGTKYNGFGLKERVAGAKPMAASASPAGKSAGNASVGLGGTTARYDLSPLTSAHPEARIENGKVILNFSVKRDKELLEHNGIAEADWKYQRSEDDIEISGLVGKCVKVYFTNYGQDVNPLLYMLMDNGNVQMLDLNTALRWTMDGHVLVGGFWCAGPLPGAKNVVALAEEVSDDGTLTTIVGKTKDGKSYPLDTYYGHQALYRYYKGDFGIRLDSFFLSPDWRLVYMNSPADRTKSYEQFGDFSATFQCPDFTWEKFTISYGTVEGFLTDVPEDEIEAVDRTYKYKFSAVAAGDNYKVKHIAQPFDDFSRAELTFSTIEVNPFE